MEGGSEVRRKGIEGIEGIVEREVGEGRGERKVEKRPASDLRRQRHATSGHPSEPPLSQRTRFRRYRSILRSQPLDAHDSTKQNAREGGSSRERRGGKRREGRKKEET
eukprot:3833714-Rhodomonas_salina.1